MPFALKMAEKFKCSRLGRIKPSWQNNKKALITKKVNSIKRYRNFLVEVKSLKSKGGAIWGIKQEGKAQRKSSREKPRNIRRKEKKHYAQCLTLHN